MTGRFEAHITYDKEHHSAVSAFADSLDEYWTYSQITGCPILGQGTYCYLNGFGTDDRALLRRMNLIKQSLEHKGVKSLRSKIEHVIYDDKTGVNEIVGSRL